MFGLYVFGDLAPFLARTLCFLLQKDNFLVLWVFPFLADTWTNKHSPYAHENIDPFRALVMDIKKAGRAHSQKDMQYKQHGKLYLEPRNSVFSRTDLTLTSKNFFFNNENCKSGPK